MEACRARKASSSRLNFKRLDYPQLDPPEWQKWLTLKLDEGQIKVGTLALDYFGDFQSNYAAHSGL